MTQHSCSVENCGGYGKGFLRSRFVPRVRMPTRFCSVVLLGLLCLLAVPHTHAQSSAVCDRALAAAEDQYREAEYEEALRLAAACLNQSEKTPGQAVAAYRMLALIHLKRDELDQARTAVVNLLGVNPSYTADPVTNPPAYVSLVSIVQEDLQGTRTAQASAESTRTPFFRRTSTWVTLSGILIGSGVATVVALGGGAGDDPGGGEPPPGPSPLPIPPTTP